MAKIAEMLGTPFMPWQRQVVDVALEIDPDTGTFAYREVVFSVPRQNGKTSIVLAYEVDRCMSWPKPQRVAYSAQTGKDAREKLVDDQFPMLRASPFDVAVKRYYEGVGKESVVFRNGSRIGILSSGEESGHGKTINLAVLDELFADEDDRREGAVIPAMATITDGQIVACSTAGHARSMLWNRKVRQGRECVDRGDRSGVAFFEWSAHESADPDDESVWWSCMPALGRTIHPPAVRHARRSMDDAEFRRAWLNIPTVLVESRVFPDELWSAVLRPAAAPEGRLSFGVALTSDRARASVAVAGENGVVELVKAAAGVSWVVDDVARLAADHGAEVALDGGGPAGALQADLEAAGVRVRPFGTRDMVYACGSLFDEVADGKLTVRVHQALDASVACARRRKVSEAWMWARDVPGDPSPLEAVTVARWAAKNPAALPVPAGIMSL